VSGKKHQSPTHSLADGDPLATLERTDFSGETAFRQLSAEQKLLWLVHAASFVLEARQARFKQEAHEETSRQ
jgi:hypothetical protein